MSSNPTHLEMLLQVHPRGPYALESGSNYRTDLAVLGTGFDSFDTNRVELLDEVLPDRVVDLLTSWERVYDLHPPSGRSAADRALAIQAARETIPSFTPTAIDLNMEELTGLAITIVECSSFRCDEATSLCDTVNDVVDGQFVAFITFAEAAARIATRATRAEMETELSLTKPAHTVVRVQCDDFRTDDPYSLVDFDLLGA